MSEEVRFDNCLIEIDNEVFYALPTKLVNYVKKLYESNKSYQRQIENLGDKLAENTNYWVRTTDERNYYQEQLQQKENIIKEVRELINYNYNAHFIEEDTNYIGEGCYKDILEILDKK